MPIYASLVARPLSLRDDFNVYGFRRSIFSRQMRKLRTPRLYYSMFKIYLRRNNSNFNIIDEKNPLLHGISYKVGTLEDKLRKVVKENCNMNKEQTVRRKMLPSDTFVTNRLLSDFSETISPIVCNNIAKNSVTIMQ